MSTLYERGKVALGLGERETRQGLEFENQRLTEEVLAANHIAEIMADPRFKAYDNILVEAMNESINQVKKQRGTARDEAAGALDFIERVNNKIHKLITNREVALRRLKVIESKMAKMTG